MHLISEHALGRDSHLINKGFSSRKSTSGKSSGLGKLPYANSDNVIKDIKAVEQQAISDRTPLGALSRASSLRQTVNNEKESSFSDSEPSEDSERDYEQEDANKLLQNLKSKLNQLKLKGNNQSTVKFSIQNSAF